MTDIDILTIVIYSVVALLVLLSNGTVILVIVKSRELHLPTIWNIAFMAAWDFSYGLYFLIFAVPSKLFDEFAYSKETEAPVFVLFSIITVQNILNILIAILDRYSSVCWPLHYPQLMSAKRFTFAVMCLFLINSLCHVPFAFTGDCFVYNKDLGLGLPEVQNISYYIPRVPFPLSGVIIIILVIKIRLELNKRGRHVNTGGTPPVSNQFTYTMFLSAVLYLICYLPPILSVILKETIDSESLVPLLKFSATFTLCNRFWNVFIYAFTYKPFRDAFLRLFCPSYTRKRAQRKIRIGYQKKTMITTIA